MLITPKLTADEVITQAVRRGPRGAPVVGLTVHPPGGCGSGRWQIVGGHLAVARPGSAQALRAHWALDGPDPVRDTSTMGDPGEVEDVVRRLLAGAPTMYLSTAADDEPWGAGAFFAESNPFTLSLVLELHGRTLQNIRRNPRVALVVSSGNPFEPFLQGSADAEVLESAAAIEATRDSLRAKAPQIEPLLAMPMAAVRLHVTMWRATDVVKGWLPGKELVASETMNA